MKAKDIMTREVFTVRPETSLEELASVLSGHRISGVPVVDEAGNLVGIVTEKDLIRKDARLHIPTVIRLFDAVISFEKPGRLLEEMKRMAATTVEEICTKDPVTIDPETSLAEIATLMTERNVNPLPVVENGRLVGIVGKVDVVRAMSAGHAGS